MDKYDHLKEMSLKNRIESASVRLKAISQLLLVPEDKRPYTIAEPLAGLAALGIRLNIPDEYLRGPNA